MPCADAGRRCACRGVASRAAVGSSPPAADRVIRGCDVPSGRLAQTLQGHTELVYSLDYSPDGSRLVSTSTDQTVRLWAADTGDHVLTIPSRRAGVRRAVRAPRDAAGGHADGRHRGDARCTLVGPR